MKNKEKTLELLQSVASAVMGGSQQHFIHATINNQKGYTKLGNRMMEEFSEEVASVGKMINRISELGGVIKHEIVKYDVYEDVEAQLRNENKQQIEGLRELEEMLSVIELDIVTKDLFVDYMKEETAHGTWLKQQVDLIDAIGIQNYLAKKI